MTSSSPRSTRTPATLRVERVRKTFGGVTAVDGVDLALAPGQAMAVIGPNGAGKSTLLKLVAGVHHADEGRIYLGETRIDRLPPHKITRRGIALAHQVPRPFAGLTVEDNVRIGGMAAHPQLSRRDIDETLELCGLGESRDARRGRCGCSTSSGWRSPGRSPRDRRSSCSTKSLRGSSAGARRGY